MTAYKRIVTYLYLCQKTAPPKNVGFAKVESVGETCRIEIHLRYQQELPIYIFTRQEEIIQGILLGKMQEQRSGSIFKKSFSREHIADTEYRLEEMGGFVLPIDEDSMIAGQWDKKDIIRQQFRIWEPPQLKTASETSSRQTGAFDLTTQQLAQTVQQISKMETRRLEEPEYTWEETWKRFEEDGEIYEPMEGVDAKGFRMDIKDLHTLPKHLWAIGNNSFLLHGFFNYRFLLVGKMRRGEKEQYFIGVPGMFSNQESVIASVFGFTEFYCEKIAEVKTGQSGYWCNFYESD